MLYVWIGVVLVAIGAELLTHRLFAIWAVPAGVCGLVLALCRVEPLFQLAVFAGTFAVGLALSYIFFRKNHTTTFTDLVIGKSCLVTERVDDTGCGQVLIGGQYWAARGVHRGDIFEKNDVVRVVAVEGVKLLLKK